MDRPRPVLEWRERARPPFSWAPPVFVESVQRGVDMNPDVCIQWLDDWSAPGPRQLLIRKVAHVDPSRVKTSTISATPIRDPLPRGLTCVGTAQRSADYASF